MACTHAKSSCDLVVDNVFFFFFILVQTLGNLNLQYETAKLNNISVTKYLRFFELKNDPLI